MSELIELVFEGQTEAVAVALLIDVLLEASCLQTTSIDGQQLETPLAPAVLVRRIESIGSLRLSSLKLPDGSIISEPIIRIIRCKDGFDVEINWLLSAGPGVTALQFGLHDFANQIALKYGVLVYYAGLDPAIDTDTRIFTGAHSGPCGLSDFEFCPEC